MRRRIWQFLLPIHHDVSSDRAWWLPYREPCVSCQSPASAGLWSPGDSRSHSRHVGNTRRRRLITCCRLWPAARRFWLGLHLLTTHSPSCSLVHYSLAPSPASTCAICYRYSRYKSIVTFWSIVDMYFSVSSYQVCSALLCDNEQAPKMQFC